MKNKSCILQMLFTIFLQQQVINCILAGIGLIFSGVIFHIGTKEPKEMKPKSVCNVCINVTFLFCCLIYSMTSLSFYNNFSKLRETQATIPKT